MKDISWGMIGCGEVCELKSGPAFQKAEGSRLVALMRRNAEKAEDFAQRHGVERWYSDAGKLVSDPGVDAVYVATPPDSHAELAILAARAGKPVYVEKPLSRSAKESETILRACREARVPLFVAYYRRQLPRFLAIRELLDSGEIGRVRQVNLSLLRPAPLLDEPLPWRFLPERSGGGKFVDLGSHMLDFLDFVLGPAEEVRGIAGKQGVPHEAEDAVSALISYPKEVQAMGQWAFSAEADSEYHDRFEFYGSRGRLSFSFFRVEPLCLETPDGSREIPVEDPPHIQQPLIQSIVDELRGKGQCPSTGESALRTDRVMDRILENWRTST
jgi:predicted dehydrogenase